MKKKIPLKSIIILVLGLISYFVSKNKDASDPQNTADPGGENGSPVLTAPERSAPTPAAINGHGVAVVSATNSGKLTYLSGKRVTVTGKVSHTSDSSSGHQFLNFSGSPFKIFCASDQVGKFGAGGPAALYKGKEIAITGTLETYKEQPQMKLTDPAAIRTIQPGEFTTPPGLGQLKEVRSGTWESAAGLLYKGKDSQGLTRVEHVLRHARDIPDRSGTHGVFTGSEDQVFALIDEAWLKAKKKGIRPQVEGHSSTLLVPMGRKVGYAGGRSGASKGKPTLTRVFIVVRTGTSEVITAYPR